MTKSCTNSSYSIWLKSTPHHLSMKHRYPKYDCTKIISRNFQVLNTSSLKFPWIASTGLRGHCGFKKLVKPNLWWSRAIDEIENISTAQERTQDSVFLSKRKDTVWFLFELQAEENLTQGNKRDKPSSTHVILQSGSLNQDTPEVQCEFEWLFPY